MSMDGSRVGWAASTPPPLFERVAPVSVIHSAEGAFAASASSVQPTGMLIKGNCAALDLQERVTVLLFGRRLAGRITKIAEDSIWIEYAPSPEVFEVIEAFEDFVLDDDSGGFNDCRSTEFAEVTPSETPHYELPSVDSRGFLRPESPLDGLGMLLSLRENRPIIVRSDHKVTQVTLQIEGYSLAVTATPVSMAGYLLLPPAETTTIDAAIAKLHKIVNHVHPVEVEKPSPDPRDDDLPELSSDGSVTFRSLAQFLFQVDSNLSKAAVLARGSSDGFGGPQGLRLIVPGAEPIEVQSAEVLFEDQGRVGFSVHHPQALRTAIQQAISKLCGPTLHGQPSPTPAPVLREPAKPKPAKSPAPLTHRVPLDNSSPSPSALMDFARPPERERPPNGWYIGVLDWALRQSRDLEISIANDVESLTVFLHRGHVVGALRRPSPGDDRLGKRLVAQRTINADLLRRALKTSLPAKQPIGKVIINTGTVPPAEVHRALRYQFFDRISLPLEWTGGWIEIGELSSLPAESDLVAISRTTAIAHLLRRHLSKGRLGELREATRNYLHQPAKIDLSMLLPSYRLTEQEQKFLAQWARSEGSLAAAISQSRLRPIEGYRIVLLGAALGFVTLPEPTDGQP